MPQIINTNIPSMNAQRNLDTTQGSMATALQRLSSGLRINSAKDDAAGLSISTRMESTISGLTVAKRNANDAVSLAQIAEGALQESTKILQRARELAVQSANGTNAATDRASLQSEVNQLKSELSRISTSTSFNGLNLLNGELAASEFQIGANANETVIVSVADTRTNSIGSNDLKINNTDGMLNANYAKTVALDGSGIAQVTSSAGTVYTNGIAAGNDLQFTPVNDDGTAGTVVTVDVALNDPASKIAEKVNAAASGTVGYATARTGARLSGVTWNGANSAITFRVQTDAAANTSLADWTTAGAETYDDMAADINSSAAMQALGVYAVSDSTGVNVYSNKGDGLGFVVTNHVTGSNTATVSAIKLDGTVQDATTFNTNTANNNTNTLNITGVVTVSVFQNYNLTEASNTTVLLGAGQMAAADKDGLTGVTMGNRLVAQTLTIAGSRGSSTLDIAADSSAAAVKTAVNNLTSKTGVSAEATTTANIEGITATGTVSFAMKGDNSTAVSVSANVTTTDYSQLVKAINDVSGTTGITAKFDGSNAIIKLTNKLGNDIQISDFTHSSAVDYPAVSIATPVSGTGDAVAAVVTQSMNVIGNKADNSGGSTVKLYAGGHKSTLDSTVVGGKLTFTSPKAFSVSSNVDGATYSGSLFAGNAADPKSSSFQAVDVIDISTVDGAQSAIRVLDRALEQISSIRGDLGAIQSRFESTMRNIVNNIENLSSARSRIMDADFAVETANLTKLQILSQAGIAVLSQANVLPQGALALLG